MSDLFNNSTTSTNVSNTELEEFLMAEKQKAQFNSQIQEFSDLCWEKCMDRPGNKLDVKTQTCLQNCVNRFIDVSLVITNRFSQMLMGAK
ncbi:PREDICTED: mitochondrial import inner membrane translocase subunit Tim8 [Ceratosolen solmsi marchali]|uniref:Mitochondrial import inner membrane translocase subunit n=1 Tax=Ceratosolen solmsi marchali TaxID=326594 RepID=A0AAJ7DZA0_9HYME|nr:PREDICTED: mitochondrial import inner membrane translocase subunit Tim8 [Ceratosolen solmsi marchali]